MHGERDERHNGSFVAQVSRVWTRAQFHAEPNAERLHLEFMWGKTLSGSFPRRVSKDRTSQNRSREVKRLAGLAFIATAAGAIACTQDTLSPTANQRALTLASAYSTTPVGFSNLSSTFASSEGPFQPEFNDARGGGDHGFCPPGAGPGFGLGLMGGGLLGNFLGDGIGRGFFHDDTSCSFSSNTGQVTCGPTTHDGLTVTRVSKYTNAAGAAQSAIDSLTNTVNSAITVAGTVTHAFRDTNRTSIDTSTSTVNEKSNQTVTGLAAGSPSRTVNGTSAGSESTTGKTSAGAFTADRSAGDTVTNVVIPAQSSTNPHPYPTAGTVVRSMSATVTFAGQTSATTKRREVITYDGSATAKVVITENGTTQNCTLPLPHGHLTCQ